MRGVASNFLPNRFSPQQTAFLQQKLNQGIEKTKQAISETYKDSQPKWETMFHKGKMEAFSPVNGGLIWETITTIENLTTGKNLNASLDLSRILSRLVVGGYKDTSNRCNRHRSRTTNKY